MVSARVSDHVSALLSCPHALCWMLPRWDEQNALLVESHERVIKDLTEEAEAKLAVEVLAAQTLKQERESLLKEASEVIAIEPAVVLFTQHHAQKTTSAPCSKGQHD